MYKNKKAPKVKLLSPDEHTLAVVPLPQAAVALIGHGEDVGRELPHVVAAVHVHRGAVVQTWDLLVGIHRGQDGPYVGLGCQDTERIRGETWITREGRR